MNPNDESGLLLPNLVSVEKRLILSPEARSEREQMLAELEAVEEERRADDPEYDDEEPSLSERCRVSVCKSCGHHKLVFLPAKLCEKCLKRAAESAGLEFPKPGNITMNRAMRRGSKQKNRRKH